MIRIVFEIATNSQEILWGWLISFALNVTGTYRLRFLAEKTEGAERTGCWTPFVGAHMQE